jgi:hypothetical protein
MKTQALQQPINKAPSFLLSDEVLFAVEGQRQPRKLLMASATLLIAQCFRLNMTFEVRGLDQVVLVKGENGTLTGHPVLLGAVAEVKPLLEDILQNLKRVITTSYETQLAARLAEAEASRTSAILPSTADASAGTGESTPVLSSTEAPSTSS